MTKQILILAGFGALAFFSRVLPKKEVTVDELLAEMRKAALMPDLTSPTTKDRFR